MGSSAASETAVFDLYEFIAAEYGWTIRQVEEELTDEQIIGLLGSSQQRIEARFDAMVASVQVGTVIAHDKKALAHWKNRRFRAAQQSRGLTGEGLEVAVTNLAAMFPGNVTHGVMEAA